MILISYVKNTEFSLGLLNLRIALLNLLSNFNIRGEKGWIKFLVLTEIFFVLLRFANLLWLSLVPKLFKYD